RVLDDFLPFFEGDCREEKELMDKQIVCIDGYCLMRKVQLAVRLVHTVLCLMIAT
ncbi:hypothetical protein FCV25MIE_16822, partial [Fagus crenata]